MMLEVVKQASPEARHTSDEYSYKQVRNRDLLHENLLLLVSPTTKGRSP